MNNLEMDYYLKPTNLRNNLWLALKPENLMSISANPPISQASERLIVKFKSFFTGLLCFFSKKPTNHFFFRKNVLLLNPKY